MSVREIFDSSGKISSQFLPTGLANTYVDNPMAEPLDGAGFGMTNVGAIGCDSLTAVGAVAGASLSAGTGAVSCGSVNAGTGAITGGSLTATGAGGVSVSASSILTITTSPTAGINAGATVNNVDWTTFGIVGNTKFLQLIPGATYALMGSIAVDTSAGMTARGFSVSVSITSGSGPVQSYDLLNASSIKYTGTALSQAYFPFSVVFKAGTDKLTLGISCPTISGAETMDLYLAPDATLVRIL